mmetsp:Transcript_38/g.64  ORF Transcript_38/g.64 Transcript_38/m.64 type:complete len:576 (+) Transcript_38:39-1766(+)|eukprot:CAMPEP_0175130680 /NCGR_PEP_ID=MMETSP0087-20121206/6134_1 /TAXON_ID=136419 /ORGANISM="Unknown Unknown, Strain D1" /LENGTH=575 /DNA_ID=CAMNT_0016412911 /DNA_START=38 /DNA_END=1765 /DNA_ORIENTATION=+
MSIDEKNAVEMSNQSAFVGACLPGQAISPGFNSRKFSRGYEKMDGLSSNEDADNDTLTVRKRSKKKSIRNGAEMPHADFSNRLQRMGANRQKKRIALMARSLGSKIQKLVYITFFDMTILTVDTVNNTFTCDLGFELVWYENDIEALAKGESWKPNLVFRNAVGTVNVLSACLDELESVEVIERPLAVSKCNAQFVLNIQGEFRNPLYLKAFPFDRQSFRVNIVYDMYTDSEEYEVTFLDATQGKSISGHAWTRPTSPLGPHGKHIFHNQKDIMSKWRIRDLYVNAEQFHRRNKAYDNSLLDKQNKRDLENLLINLELDVQSTDILDNDELSDIESDLSSADDDDKQREAIATVQPVVNKEKKKHKLDPKMIERLINTLALSTIVDMDHFFEEKDTKCVKMRAPGWKTVGDGNVYIKASENLLAAPGLVLSARTERQPKYYIWNHMVIMMIIVMLNGISFVFDAKDGNGDRMQTNITLLLTAVAFKYSVADSLPVLPYLTYLDKFVLASFFISCFVTCGASVSHFMGSYSKYCDYCLLGILGVYALTCIFFVVYFINSNADLVRTRWSKQDHVHH